MRLVLVVLLLMGTLLPVAVTEAAPSSVESSLTAFNLQASTRYRFGNPDKRRLRFDSIKGDEERAITIPGLEKLKKWLTDFITKIKLSFNEGKQLNAWLKEDKTPEEIFHLLKLDRGTKGLLANSKIRVWSVYMTMYNKKNPTKMVTMLGVFTKTYGNLEVAKMLEIGRRNPKTYRLADRLQGIQLVAWVQNGLSTDIIFQLLKVGETNVGKLFSNPAFNVWYYYFTRLNRHNPDREVDMIKTMLTAYDDIPLAKAIEAATKVKTTGTLAKNVQSIENIATQFQNAQFKKWRAEGIDPPTIFKRLEMDKLRWGVDPNAEIFRGYKTFYNAN
ncbi:hypothetical protein PHYPSEUDO_015406 [Phytophthora pseudosyringae]|uniref:RxLR effector protein n=1 Tax=Phytophthora pseudosyringae TaxID=221518 RepID=A0A8T1V6M6_9STRA|nr:hypothetical protein PHYPSEUDO_015406 [Phytophthora pseudosyringae]